MRHIFELEDRFVEGVDSRCFGGEPEALVTSGVQKCLDVTAYRRSRLDWMSFTLENDVGSSCLQR